MSDFSWSILDNDALLNLLYSTFDAEPGVVVSYRNCSDPTVFGIMDIPNARVWMYNKYAIFQQEETFPEILESNEPAYLPLM